MWVFLRKDYAPIEIGISSCFIWIRLLEWEEEAPTRSAWLSDDLQTGNRLTTGQTNLSAVPVKTVNARPSRSVVAPDRHKRHYHHDTGLASERCDGCDGLLASSLSFYWSVGWREYAGTLRGLTPARRNRQCLGVVSQWTSRQADLLHDDSG